MKGKINSTKLCLMAFGITINVVGAFIALQLRLPIYLDSLGTIMISALLGPWAGIITGVLGSVLSGITFDIYSVYFAPVQVMTGLTAGLLFRTIWLKGKRMPLGAMVVAIPTAAMSSMVTYFVFQGATSSGSSIIVFILAKLNVNLGMSVFLTQLATDYMDKFIAIGVVSVVLTRIPQTFRYSIQEKHGFRKRGNDDGSLQ